MTKLICTCKNGLEYLEKYDIQKWGNNIKYDNIHNKITLANKQKYYITSMTQQQNLS